MEEVFDILSGRVEGGQMKVEKADLLPAALRCPVVGLDTIAGTELEEKKDECGRREVFPTALIRALHCTTGNTLSEHLNPTFYSIL